MGLWQGLQFALRLLVQDKWVTLAAAIALALGIGVNAAVFTFVNAVLIRGLPFDNPEQIMALGSHDVVRDRQMGVSYLDFKDWRESTQSFTALAAHSGSTMNVSDEGRPPERFSGALISANGFSIIGVAPIIGRGFLPDDDRPGAPAVVLIGHGVWKNRYGNDPSLIGRTVRVNDLPSTIIGVMPEGFKFPQNADMWRPLSTIRELDTQKRNSRGFEVFGRLREGVSQAQAQAEMAGIGERLARDYPETNKDIQPRVM